MKYEFDEKYAIKHCTDCDAEHRESKRQYAHVFHITGTICVAKAFYLLPITHQLGILLHEAGHILAGPTGSEKKADDAAYKASGVRIHYRDSAKYGQQLEWISPPNRKRVRQFLRIPKGL